MTSVREPTVRVRAEISPSHPLQQAQSALRYLTHPAVIKALLIWAIWAFSILHKIDWWWEGIWQWWRPVSVVRRRR
jgi:hypothetical protein